MFKPVRPSSYEMAEKCLRSPWLAARYRESNSATRFGNSVDGQVTRALANGGEIVLQPGEVLFDEAVALLDWVKTKFGSVEMYPQRKLVLNDPETNEVLTQGTADLVVLDRKAKKVWIVDWKKKGQWWAGHLSPPESNLQQLIYLAAAWMELSISSEIERGEIILACFDERGVTPKESGDLPLESLSDIIHRVRAVPRIDVDGPAPEAVKGDQCGDCYQRMHCDAYLLPIIPALVKLDADGELGVPKAMMEPGGLTNESAAACLLWLERIRPILAKADCIQELVKDNIETYVITHGPVIVGNMQYQAEPTTGKRSGPSVKELERMGRHDLIRPGKPGIKCAWEPLKEVANG